ncbi:MAG: hypothetical protein HYY61_06225 [Deltaproteobacteria bacterium]|nr:hypothetical protein [Deltaproteobacteria bacterium]
MIKQCIVLFALLIVSLEANAQEFTLLKKSFWGQAWDPGEGVFLSQLDQFYYATPNKQGYSYESRLKVGVSVSSNEVGELGRHFGYDLNARVWGLIPKEASTWVDVRSAYVEWHNLQKSNLFVKVGRILPNWGGMDEYSPIKEIFPKLVIDPLEVRSNGMVGLYGRVEEDVLDFEALGSPLFIPNFGGALYETDMSGKFYSPSRWAMPLYDTATVGKAAVPLDYKMHTPDIADVIFKLGGGVRITLRDFYDQYRFSALMMHGMDPNVRMEIYGKLTTSSFAKSNTMGGKVDMYPRFFRHTIYAFEGNIQSSTVDAHMESMYRVPDNPQDLPEYMVAPIEWKNFFAFQTKNEISFLPQLLLGLALTRQFDPYQDPNYKMPSRSLNYVVGKLYWKPLSKLSAFSASEVAVSLKEGIWKNGIEWEPMNRLSISTGLDLIMGQEDTYWGILRHQDRLWLRGTYAF